MTNAMKASIAGLLLTASMASASAAVVQVGSITRNYGSSGATPASMPAGSCDTLNASSVTVRDSSGCQRFYDLFDFGAFNYSSFDHLTLTLNFGATNDVNMVTIPVVNITIPVLEDWRVRFASSPIVGSNVLHNMNEVGSPTSQAFNLLSTENVYNSIVANKKLYLWFSDEAAGANNFQLYSARLDVYGTALPEPGSMALAGIALGALALSRRRKR